jgi:hypothetical protein
MQYIIGLVILASLVGTCFIGGRLLYRHAKLLLAIGVLWTIFTGTMGVLMDYYCAKDMILEKIIAVLFIPGMLGVGMGVCGWKKQLSAKGIVGPFGIIRLWNASDDVEHSLDALIEPMDFVQESNDKSFISSSNRYLRRKWFHMSSLVLAILLLSAFAWMNLRSEIADPRQVTVYQEYAMDIRVQGWPFIFCAYSDVEQHLMPPVWNIWHIILNVIIALIASVSIAGTNELIVRAVTHLCYCRKV